VLARREKQIKVFFRDDDGGWADERLQKLGDEFIQHELPLDVAVIPGALSSRSIDVIDTLLGAKGRVAIHQHGFDHVNHQLSGRSCEFGSDRNRIQQHDDIALGQNKLNEVFGARVDPVFTPPWNRCTSDTAFALQSLGFQSLSRIIGSEEIENAVPELPVAVDWLKKRKGVRLTTAELINYISGLFDNEAEVIGIMLHHEHMDHGNRTMLYQFIDTLRDSQKVSFHSMMNLSVPANPGMAG